jgi:hypothetical protein
MNSLERLRNPNNQPLSEVEQMIVGYLGMLNLPIIDNIYPVDGIYPYYQCFLQTGLPSGLYVMDNQRIYTPIDSGQFGVHHLMSVPKEMVPLYGLTTYKYSKIHYSEKYIVVFVGCVGTGGRNCFLSQIRGFQVYPGVDNSQHSIVPGAGIKPKHECSYVIKTRDAIVAARRIVEDDTESQVAASNHDESDEEEEEDEFFGDEGQYD